MHFKAYEQLREHRVTEALTSPIFLPALLRELKVESMPLMVRELNKSLYGKNGDVDLVFAAGWGSDAERLYAIEVKVMVLESDGHFRSEKRNKHHKQLDRLKAEGWNFVYLLDVIVTQPSEGWFHPQAFEGFDNYRKDVPDQDIGHIVLLTNAIAHKPEIAAGSFSFKRMQPATENVLGGECVNEIRTALVQVWGNS